jgi:hypothetical protein
MALVLVAAGIGAVVLSRYLAAGDPPPAPESAPPAVETRKIKARLFYVAEDGVRLVPGEREVTFGATTLEQARRIIEAQLEPVAPPLVSAIPPGTRLRALYLTDTNEAFVDLTAEVRSAHPGGLTNEILTVYAVVDALTVNLPALAGVQILVDGREVDTLAGHVDLRRPLTRSNLWVDEGTPR